MNDNNIIKRINLNEKRLNKTIEIINTLEKGISEYKKNTNEIKKLNKYYGSNNWFKDKDLFESKGISNISAGVLSEDGVWNMLDNLDEVMKKMYTISNDYIETKKKQIRK